jgi:hypothetical protein
LGVGSKGGLVLSEGALRRSSVELLQSLAQEEWAEAPAEPFEAHGFDLKGGEKEEGGEGSWVSGGVEGGRRSRGGSYLRAAEAAGAQEVGPR